jgi:hypothetical protein
MKFIALHQPAEIFSRFRLKFCLTLRNYLNYVDQVRSYFLGRLPLQRALARSVAQSTPSHEDRVETTHEEIDDSFFKMGGDGGFGCGIVNGGGTDGPSQAN